MFSQAIRYLVPIGVAVYIPSTVHAKCESDVPKNKIAPSDLYKEPCGRSKSEEEIKETELEKCVKLCREGLAPVAKDVTAMSSQVSVFFKDTLGVIKDNVDYLQNKAPEEVKYASIAGGSLVGMLLGVRKGLIRKLFYASLTGAGTFSMIYPQDARVYAKEGVAAMKKYGKIAYNFAVLDPNRDQKPPQKNSPVSKNMQEKKDKDKCQ